MTQLIDTYGEPSPALLSHYAGAMRYVSHQAGKSIDRGQVERIHAQGKNIVLNFEDSQSNPKGGYDQGRTDAEFCVGVAHQIGAPAGIAIYYSVDFEVHGGPLLATVEAYFRGVASIMRPAGYLIGAYGDKDLLTALLDHKLIDFAWLTTAWSYGAKDARAVLYQDQFHSGFDVDEVEHPYYGAWTPTGPQEEYVPLTDADVVKIWTHDLANGAPVAEAYAVIVNIQKALAEVLAEVAAIKSKVGA